MYDHVVPKRVMSRIARQIAGRDDLSDLSKEEKNWLGKQVAALRREFNDDELALFSTKFEWEKEKEK